MSENERLLSSRSIKTTFARLQNPRFAPVCQGRSQAVFVTAIVFAGIVSFVERLWTGNRSIRAVPYLFHDFADHGPSDPIYRIAI